MQKRKNIQMLVSLGAMIIAIIVLFVFNNSNDKSEVDKTIFQIANLEKVDHIVFQSPKEKIDLKFNGTTWLVNGVYEADQQMITVLFAALKQVEAKRKVAQSIQDSVKNEISKNGIKVSCFEKNVLAKEFWSEGNSQKSETYFQLSDGVSYIVTIPGYRVYVASVFEVPANDWRDKRVFSFNWQNIKSLEVSFPGDTKQNFKASFTGGLFGIEGIATDTTKLDKFMDGLFQLRSEKILDSIEAKNYQSALAKIPLMEIKIYDIGNQSYPLTIFPIEKGSNVIVGKINDVVLLNPMAIREVFKKKEYFIQK